MVVSIQYEEPSLARLLRLAVPDPAAGDRRPEVANEFLRMETGVDDAVILAQQFLARIFRDRAELVVRVGYRAARIGDGDDGVLVKRRPQVRDLLQGIAQRLFGAFAISDVAKDRRDSRDIALGVLDRRDGQRDIDFAAILGHARRFVMIDALARRDPRRDAGLLVDPTGRNHARDRLSDHLLGAKAEQARRPGVPAGDDPVETLAENCVGRGCDNRRKPLIDGSRRLDLGDARPSAAQHLGHADNKGAT